jgi:hypothetical protein
MQLTKIAVVGILSSLIFFSNLNNAYCEDVFTEFEIQVKKLKTPEEKRAYLGSLGVKKSIILGGQVWEKLGSEDAYWVGYYGISPLWMKDTSEVIKSVPSIYSTRAKLNPQWRKMLKKSINGFVKQSTLSREKNLINNAIDFIENKGNSAEDKSYVISFIRNTWFIYFEKAKTSSQRKEIFNALNTQAEKIIGSISSLSPSSPQLIKSKRAMLQSFREFYTNKSLPHDFKQGVNFKGARSKIIKRTDILNK